MLTATTTIADSQAHYALAPDLVAAPRQNYRHLPRPVKRRLQLLLSIKRISSRSAALTGFGSRYTAARDNCNNAHCGVTGKSLRPASTFLIRSGQLIS